MGTRSLDGVIIRVQREGERHCFSCRPKDMVAIGQIVKGHLEIQDMDWDTFYSLLANRWQYNPAIEDLEWSYPDGVLGWVGDTVTLQAALEVMTSNGNGYPMFWISRRDIEGTARLVSAALPTTHSLTEEITTISRLRPLPQKLPDISRGYAQSKEKAGPTIVKRADGQYVKLVCSECHRDDFSKAQGFISHCRIRHDLVFRSHKEAAAACGQLIETDKVGGIEPAACPSNAPTHGDLGSPDSLPYLSLQNKAAHTPLPNDEEPDFRVDTRSR
ncbi:uncharacterized protein PAC_11467 [Phialocephala subalpina]|uniref:AHC1-like C2H2 zinc-finger domain-containing protein n=1 Tax=Phialocephala subalpina TaxID=576137 RepID=A0A1L7X977_9HELO|nr:uncharacterized protein PAC_11467 [Phialocephala subalpina]